MKLKVLIILAVSITTILSQAETRKSYSVTGTADDTGFAYESTICDWATINAQAKASRVCYEEGFNNGWIYASYGDCSNQWFGLSSGKKIKMEFFCH